MKKQHPIRKMQRASTRIWNAGNTAHKPAGEIERLDRLAIARHVKPLLDVGMGKIPHLYAGLCYDSQFPENAGDPKCPACRLLAEWRRPL